MKKRRGVGGGGANKTSKSIRLTRTACSDLGGALLLEYS